MTLNLDTVGCASRLHHFFDPRERVAAPTPHAVGLIKADNGIVYGGRLLARAVTDYGMEGKKRAYFTLGRLVHLLQDLTSPPHTVDAIRRSEGKTRD